MKTILEQKNSRAIKVRHKQIEITAAVTANMSIYMAYLLRYVSVFPVSAAQLQKKAADKRFSRLARYLGELPPDRTFKSAQDVLNLLKDPNQ